MASGEREPVVGNWYHHRDKGQSFLVVAVDEDADLIEVQHFDGDLESFDFDEWNQLDIEGIEEPEDFSGALDVAEIDDLGGTNVTDTDPGDWSEPLQEELIKEREEGPEQPAAEEEENGDDGDAE